jgi:hypothetical protein
MRYKIYWNDSRITLFPNGRRFNIFADGILDVALSFTIVGIDSMCMEAYEPLTFITGGIMRTVSKGTKVTLPVDKDVYLVSMSNPDRIHKMRISNTITTDETPKPHYNLRICAPDKPPVRASNKRRCYALK